jgi:hypothetical protein
MAMISLIGKTLSGKTIPITISSNATVEELYDAVKLKTYRDYQLSRIRVKNGPLLTDYNRKLSNYNAIRDGATLFLMPRQFSGPPRILRNNKEKAEQVLTSYLTNTNRRMRGATMRAASNQRKILNNAIQTLPNNLLNYELAEYLGQPIARGGKTRKSKKSRRQTRRR